MSKSKIINKEIDGIKYTIIQNKKEIHEKYQLNVKKQLKCTNHSTFRWFERVGNGDFQRGLSSSFKLIHIKKLILKEDDTRIYVSHKDIAFIITDDNKLEKEFVLLTILTKEDVLNNPNKIWWFE